MVEKVNFNQKVSLFKKWTHGVGGKYFILYFHIPKKIETFIGLKEKQKLNINLKNKQGFEVKI